MFIFVTPKLSLSTSHTYIFETNVAGGNPLLDMDAKCGWDAEDTWYSIVFQLKMLSRGHH